MEKPHPFVSRMTELLIRVGSHGEGWTERIVLCCFSPKQNDKNTSLPPYTLQGLPPFSLDTHTAVCTRQVYNHRVLFVIISRSTSRRNIKIYIYGELWFRRQTASETIQASPTSVTAETVGCPNRCGHQITNSTKGSKMLDYI